MNKFTEVFLPVILTIIGVACFLIGLVWLMNNAPTRSTDSYKIEGIGTFVCIEEYKWLRKDYNKSCIEWPK